MCLCYNITWSWAFDLLSAFTVLSVMYFVHPASIHFILWQLCLISFPLSVMCDDLGICIKSCDLLMLIIYCSIFNPAFGCHILIMRIVSHCICIALHSGPPGIPVQKLENSLTQYQNFRKFSFLKYSKTSHKRTFRSVSFSSFAGFSRTAFCRASNGNFFK